MEKFNIDNSFSQLTQDEKSDIQLLQLIGGNNSFLIAELKPGKVLPAHYHNEGSEIYHVLSGTGLMETGTMVDAKTVWETCTEIRKGDVFEITQTTVHRLSNQGEEKLRLVFITPSSHLGGDRVFV